MNKCYVMMEGTDFSSGYILYVSKTKKKLVEMCKKDGFKYHKKENLWSFNECDQWRSINIEDFID